MYCENCKKEFIGKVKYSDFNVLCAECKNDETKIEEENFADKMEGYIDRISRGLTEIEDDE